jgi:hypothetical protein
MFKIIELDPSENDLYVGKGYLNPKKYNWFELKNEPILQSQEFEKTLVGIGSTSVLDLEKRSSLTHKLQFYLNLPSEAYKFLEQNKIFPFGKYSSKYQPFSLLKYEEGDFFLNHRDTNLTTDEIEIHKYTCLIFCPYGEDNEILEGGELVLKHPDGLYEIKFDPAVETRKNRFVMVIFSIDMYHEVLPIIKGSRWVFKKPLFVIEENLKKTEEEDKSKIEEKEEDILCDGGAGMYWSTFLNSGDY